MDEYVKVCIESRINSIYDNYIISDEKLKSEIDKLSEDMNNLGKSVKDVGEFETKFANSDLNERYMNLFTKISTSCKMINREEEEIETNEVIKDAVRPIKRMARYEADKKIRNIPVLGDAVRIKQHTDLFKGVFGKKKDK